MMDHKRQSQIQTWLVGCGLLLLAVVFLLAGLLLVLAGRERHALRFPGSVQTPALTGTQLRSTYLRQDNGYRSQASLVQIANWYADTFRLTISEESDLCISLDGISKGPGLQRRTSVTICDASAAREIWITRIISSRSIYPSPAYSTY